MKVAISIDCLRKCGFYILGATRGLSLWCMICRMCFPQVCKQDAMPKCNQWCPQQSYHGGESVGRKLPLSPSRLAGSASNFWSNEFDPQNQQIANCHLLHLQRPIQSVWLCFRYLEHVRYCHLVRCLDCTSWLMLTSVSVNYNKGRDSQGLILGKVSEKQRLQGVREFEVAHSKWMIKQGQIQGKSYSVQDSREFKIAELKLYM